jgi:hypothetical protein
MSAHASTYALFSRLRWVGVLFFLCGAAVLAMSIWAVAQGAPARQILLGVFSMGLSLGSFGAANDTAVHALREGAKAGAALSGAEAAELRVESERRPARLGTLHASPKAAFILPLVVIGAWAWWGWGLSQWLAARV